MVLPPSHPSPLVQPSLRPRPRRVAIRAFTIVEVMMAAIVMAFAITTSITTLQRGFLSIDTARNFVIAGQIMQSEIEKMRVSPWSTTATVTGIVDYTNTVPAIAVDTVFTSNTHIGTRFTMTRTMSDPKADLRKVTLTISWTSYDGRTISRSYDTYYARYGLYDFFSS